MYTLHHFLHLAKNLWPILYILVTRTTYTFRLLLYNNKTTLSMVQ